MLYFLPLCFSIRHQLYTWYYKNFLYSSIVRVVLARKIWPRSELILIRIAYKKHDFVVPEEKERCLKILHFLHMHGLIAVLLGVCVYCVRWIYSYINTIGLCKYLDSKKACIQQLSSFFVHFFFFFAVGCMSAFIHLSKLSPQNLRAKNVNEVEAVSTQW